VDKQTDGQTRTDATECHVIAVRDMSLESAPTTINIIPATPVPSAQNSPAPPTTDDVATDPAAAGGGGDDAGDDKEGGMLQQVADDKIEMTSAWLRHHADIFTHLSAGLL